MEARKSSWASAHAQLWTSSCDEDSGARVFPLDVDCSSTVRSTDGTTGPASNALFVWAEDLRLPNRDKNTIRQLLKLMDSLLNSAHSHGVTVLENHATIFKDIALSLSESAQHTPDVDLLLQTAARSAVVDTSICDARLGAPPMRNNEHSQLINELRKVADTLEQCGYGDSTRSASENLLELVGDTEQLKRQNNLQTILCQSYEATVQRVMASYGEVLFPTIDGEKNRLAGTAPESSPVWLEEYFRQILNAMKPFDCDPGLVSPLFMGDATHIRKTIRKFTDEVLRCLSRLNNCSDFVQNHSEGSSLELRERVAMLEKALRSIMAHGSFSHIGQSSKAELSQELCDTVVNSVKGLVEEYDSTLCRIGDIDATIIPLLDVNASVPRINSASGALLSQVITVESHLSSLLESHLNLMAQKRSMENETKESVHALTQLLPYCGKPTGAVTTAASTRLQDIVGAFTERLRNGRKNYSNDKNQDRSDDSELVAYLKRKKPRIDCIFDEMLFSSSDERNEETIGTSATYSSFVETFVNQVVEKLSSLHEMFVNRGRELERLRERCSGQCSFVDAIKLRVSSTDQSVNKIVQHLGLDIGGKEQLPHDPIRNLVAAGNQQQDFAVDLLAEEQVVSLLDRVLSKLHLTELHIASTKTVESSACKSMSSGPRDPVGHSSDSSSYRETVRVVLRKLAQGGSQIKTTLFLIGSDETASDEVIDEAIKKTSQDIGALTTEGNDEVHEELLAVLLQKYSRWGQRLLEATEEHVAGQKKILKYMKGIRLFFSPSRQHDESEATRGDTLLDIDADLFRLVDTILPAIDRLTRPAESPRAGISGNGAVDSHFVRSVKESQAPASTQEHDSRLQHLYDSVVKLRNMIDALRRGRYLTIPSGAKQVRGSDEYELVFDDETDSWEGKDSGATHHQLSSPNHPLHETGSAVACRPGDNEELIKVALQNTESLCRSVLKFSANYKMAAIIIQKDTDALQQLLADLLEKYSEVDVENAFGQDREELRTLYSVLRERGTRQKGCYFFSRIGGEGKCVWNSAVQLLSTGYNVLIDRMLQNTTLLSEGQEFTARVRHLCSTYARWCQQHCDSESLSASIKRLADDGEPIERASATAKSNNHESGGYSLLSPASTGDTLSVLEHMIKCVMSSQQVLAARMQDGCSSNGMNVDVSDLARLNAEGNRSSTQIEDLWMEKRKLEQERDQALSEAAVAKAQLRRMRNSAAPDGAENQNIPASNLDEIQGSGTHSPVDSDSCPTRVEDYVRALEVEIAYARQVAEAQCPEHSTASKIDILPNRDKDPSRVFTEKKFLAYVCPNSAYENILGKNKQHVEVLANSVKPTTSMQGTPDQRTKRRPQSSASRRSDSCGKGSPTCRTENQKKPTSSTEEIRVHPAKNPVSRTLQAASCDSASLYNANLRTVALKRLAEILHQ